jgi:hypothetical protein
MTRTGPADVVVSACARIVPGWPVPARPGPRGLAAQSRRPRLVRPPLRRQRARAPQSPSPRLPTLAYPLYLYLFGWHAATFFGWSIDPGRDILCILTSPLRRLQWP